MAVDYFFHWNNCLKGGDSNLGWPNVTAVLPFPGSPVFPLHPLTPLPLPDQVFCRFSCSWFNKVKNYLFIFVSCCFLLTFKILFHFLSLPLLHISLSSTYTEFREFRFFSRDPQICRLSPHIPVPHTTNFLCLHNPGAAAPWGKSGLN